MYRGGQERPDGPSGRATILNIYIRIHAPRCSVHGVPARVLKVKKAKNGNKGRRFLLLRGLEKTSATTSLGWCEDHAPAVAAVLKARSSLGLAQSGR